MTNKLIVSLGFSVLAAAAFASPIQYGGDFSGLNESPPNASPGTGWALITVDATANTMRVQAQFSGLLGNVTASHIHARADANTANGPVATQVPTFAGFPGGVQAGSYDNTFDMSLAASWNPTYITNNGGTVASAWNVFLNKMATGLTYMNIHTNLFTGGELRANLVPVPEPGTVAALGLGALLVLRRRRKS